MRKFRVVFVGAMLLFLLAACSNNEQDEIIGVFNDFSDVMESGDEEFEKVEMLINEYTMEVMSEEEFEEEKTVLFGYFDELKNDVDAIDKPKSDRGQEYYDLSYKVVDEMIAFSKDMLDVPSLDDFDSIGDYETTLIEGISKLETSIEELATMQEELEEEDDAYKEAFNE